MRPPTTLAVGAGPPEDVAAFLAVVRRRGRLHRHPRPARRFAVLQRRCGGRLPSGWDSVFDHDRDDKRAIAAIGDSAWRQIRYPTGVLDPDTGEMIYDAQVAEVRAYTAFTGRPKSDQVTARLIVRRVRDLAKPATQGEQG